MNIYNVLKNTLQTPLSPIPCVPTFYGGTATTYVTYFQYNKKGQAYAETNKEMAKGYYVQVDFWSNTLQPDKVEQIESLLANGKFYNVTSNDLYDSETKIYHAAIRAVYYDMHS